MECTCVGCSDPYMCDTSCNMPLYTAGTQYLAVAFLPACLPVYSSDVGSQALMQSLGMYCVL